jgi:hypothetical protein
VSEGAGNAVVFFKIAYPALDYVETHFAFLWKKLCIASLGKLCIALLGEWASFLVCHLVVIMGCALLYGCASGHKSISGIVFEELHLIRVLPAMIGVEEKMILLLSASV